MFSPSPSKAAANTALCFNKAIFSREVCRFGAIPGSGFPQNAADMVRDRFNANEKNIRNFLVSFT